MARASRRTAIGYRLNPDVSILPGYSYDADFRGINARQTIGNTGMNSESVAGVLAAIVASIVLVIAIAYGPIGQYGKPAKPQKVEQPAQPAAPAVRGPVVREVPQ
jgi:tetrahydromethanopterin S-methyltransferase subunit F